MKKLVFVLVLLFIFPFLVDFRPPPPLYKDKPLPFPFIVRVSPADPPFYADKPDIVGFRDMRWKDPISQHASELIEIRAENKTSSTWSRCYVKKKENLQIGEATVDRIEYLFFKGVFFEVCIYTTTYSDWLALKNYISVTYEEDSQQYYWLRKSGYIRAGWNDHKKPPSGFTSFHSSL